jgi:hypothetical protein
LLITLIVCGDNVDSHSPAYLNLYLPPWTWPGTSRSVKRFIRNVRNPHVPTWVPFRPIWGHLGAWSEFYGPILPIFVTILHKWTFKFFGAKIYIAYILVIGNALNLFYIDRNLLKMQRSTFLSRNLNERYLLNIKTLSFYYCS